MSPEQLSRQPIDHRADLYAIGCVFYKALAQRFPFTAQDVPSLIAAHLQHDHTALAELRPDLPSPLADWVENLFAYNKDERPQTAAEALGNLERLGNPAPPAKRPDNTGKPSLANPNLPSPHKKQKAPAKSEPAPEGTTTKTPFHRTQNFVVTMVAVTAVSATIIVLALTGHLGGGGSRPVAFAKKEKVQPAPAEKTTFKSTERGEIKDMVGKKITVTGDIDRLERDDKGRYLIFKDSDPRRDVMVFFDPATTEVSEWVLKRKFAGHKVRATGTVKLDGTRLLLELISMDDLKLHADAPPTGN
jgi:serine/threonine protein kinase